MIAMITMMMTMMMTMTMAMAMAMTILYRQVTYAFCKEFASLLSELVTSEGDLPVVKILTTIFEQVGHHNDIDENIDEDLKDAADEDDDTSLEVTRYFCSKIDSNLNEICCPNFFLKIPQSTKAANVSKAFHRYALNYINALNYLETLRRQQEFSDFEKVAHF